MGFFSYKCNQCDMSLKSTHIKTWEQRTTVVTEDGVSHGLYSGYGEVMIDGGDVIALRDVGDSEKIGTYHTVCWVNAGCPKKPDGHGLQSAPDQGYFTTRAMTYWAPVIVRPKEGTEDMQPFEDLTQYLRDTDQAFYSVDHEPKTDVKDSPVVVSHRAYRQDGNMTGYPAHAIYTLEHEPQNNGESRATVIHMVTQHNLLLLRESDIPPETVSAIHKVNWPVTESVKMWGETPPRDQSVTPPA